MERTHTVVIVARTRMYGGRVCVGALSAEGENLRLMNRQCSSDHDQDSPYRIGEEWKITCEPCGLRRPPHIEDVAVSHAKRQARIEDLAGYILKRATPWKGPIETLFEGQIQFTRNGAGFISDTGIPPGATGFWIPSTDVLLEHDDRNKAGYYPRGDYRHLAYVGLEDAVAILRAGKLIRVSLARWWRPENVDPDFEERCYAQLSGWY